MSDDVTTTYGRLAGRYIELFDNIDSVHPDDIAFIERHLGGASGRVIDVGCGPGHLTAHLRSLGLDAAGIDPVPEFIEHARVAHPDAEFEVGSLADIATTSGASGPNRVASLASNRWGLYDTLGNVSEWCHDLYERHESGAVVDPTGTRYGVNRVTRGGSFLDPAASVRFTARESREPRSKSPAIGFRPVRTIGATP